MYISLLFFGIVYNVLLGYPQSVERNFINQREECYFLHNIKIAKIEGKQMH